jgi:hypothetical protein
MMVKRKKTDVVQLSKIRMRGDLHTRLVQSAERRESTLNGEIVHRLEQSFARDGARESQKLQVEKDAEVLNLLIGNNEAAADALRRLVFEMQTHLAWDESKAGRKAMADRAHAILFPQFEENEQ